jgi:hypothetical protein
MGQGPESRSLTSLIGKWWGEARHGAETAELGFSFDSGDNHVLAREWLPNINAYGSELGSVNVVARPEEKAAAFSKSCPT